MEQHTPSFGPVPPLALVPLRTPARPDDTPDDATAVRPLLRPIAAWRMDCTHFEFDSSFINATARGELEHLARLRVGFPGAPASVFAHADPTGDDNYNKHLSGRRALALFGLLVRDRELWEELWTTPMAGDAWGDRSLQVMLGAVPDATGVPYYAGPIDGLFGPDSTDALRRFQADHPPLVVDGLVGPNSRRELFGAYMDLLCSFDDGSVLQMVDDDFLARGADPEHRGDVQGCSEFNPAMVFSQEEHQRFLSPALREERDAENAMNRRAVVFLYPESAVIDPADWPCPAARDGVAQCRARLWSDAAQRRNPGPARRHFDEDRDTFACRFYHYFGVNTPAETPRTLGLTFDLYLHHGFGGSAPELRYRLASQDGDVVEERDLAQAVLMRTEPTEVRCLSFTGLPQGLRYTLSHKRPDDPEFRRLVLLEDFTLEQLAAQPVGDDPAERVTEYVVAEDDDYLSYVPPAPGGSVDWEDDTGGGRG